MIQGDFSVIKLDVQLHVFWFIFIYNNKVIVVLCQLYAALSFN